MTLTNGNVEYSMVALLCTLLVESYLRYEAAHDDCSTEDVISV